MTVDAGPAASRAGAGVAGTETDRPAAVLAAAAGAAGADVVAAAAKVPVRKSHEARGSKHQTAQPAKRDANRPVLLLSLPFLLLSLLRLLLNAPLSFPFLWFEQKTAHSILLYLGGNYSCFAARS